MAEPQQGANTPSNEQEMITFIVNSTNQLLSRSLSLVDFDELSPVQLLQVLSDVFGTLSPQAAVNFSQESQEMGAARLAEFLTRTLGYKPPPIIASTFPRGFSQAEKTIVYPVLYWVLKRMGENAKRVYLAKYLTRIEIPEDLMISDEGVRDTHQHYESLREDFIQTHKRVESLKEARADPTEARRKLSQMEVERDRLNQYLAAAQKKLASAPEKDALLNVCRALRAEQEDSVKLTEKREEQSQAHLTMQKRLSELSNRLRDAQRDMQETRTDVIIQRLRDEIQTNNMKLQQTLPHELNEKRVQNAALGRLLSEPLDISSLQTETTQLDRELAALSKQVEQRQLPGEDGSSITMMKQQVQRVQKKKSDCLAELNQLQNENQRYLEELRQKEQQLEQLRGSKMLKGEDFKRYANQVRSKTAASKNMKTRLSDLRGEYGVLDYTEKLLRSKYDHLLADLNRMEARVGAQGYVSTASALSRVSDEKNQVEQIKGQTLDELSVVVQQLKQQIEERRQKLSPQLQDLRKLRTEAQVVEQEHDEKKSAYDYQEGLLMQEVNKLESEVASLTEETLTSESLYHRLQCQKAFLEIQTKRATDEKEFRNGTGTLSATAKTNAGLIAATTEQLEGRSKDLQKRRRDIEEHHESHLQQVEWFTALRKLLECKVRSLHAPASRGTGAAAPGQSLDTEISNAIMGGPSNHTAVDMLVLGSN